MKYVLAILLGLVGLDIVLGAFSPDSVGHKSIYHLVSGMTSSFTAQLFVGGLVIFVAIVLVVRMANLDIRKNPW